jgi:hypothetical protein
VDPEDALHSHNDKNITKADHLSTDFENKARSMKKAYDFKKIVECQHVALPFKVELKFVWEIVLVNHSNTRLRTSYQDQYHFKLVVYLIGTDKLRKLVDPGSIRLAAAHATTPCPTNNAALQAYISQQQVVPQKAAQQAAAQQVEAQ